MDQTEPPRRATVSATALGCFALSLALAVHSARRGLPCHLGWWGLTFPRDVFAAGTHLRAAFWPLAAARTLRLLVRSAAGRSARTASPAGTAAPEAD